MKLMDIFKNLGVDPDVEIEDTSKDTSKLKNEENSGEDVNNNKKEYMDKKMNITINTNNSTSKKDENTKKEEDIKEMDYKQIKFDVNTGLFDLSNIDNADLKNVLQLSNDTVKAMSDKVKIDMAFNEKLNSLKIRKGITPDAVRTLIKMDGVKVDNDKVIGLDEAFDNLQKEQSGLFVQRNTPDSNPVLEGFNPSSNNGNNCLDSALASLASSLTSE